LVGSAARQRRSWESGRRDCLFPPDARLVRRTLLGGHRRLWSDPMTTAPLDAQVSIGTSSLRVGPGVCDPGDVAKRRQRTIVERLPIRITGMDARGPGLRGPTAMAPVAIGALAVGAVAIGRLAIGRATIKRLTIDELEVKRLKVTELEVAGEQRLP
jgi:hypothetical protein